MSSQLVRQRGDVMTVEQGEKFTGLLVPFVSRMITDTQADFARLNQALKQ